MEGTPATGQATRPAPHRTQTGGGAMHRPAAAVPGRGPGR